MQGGYAFGGLVVNGPIQKVLSNLDVRIGERVMPHVQYSRSALHAMARRTVSGGDRVIIRKKGAPARDTPFDQFEWLVFYFVG